jgi:membrane-bound serine protease (ClpP class)
VPALADRAEPAQPAEHAAIEPADNAAPQPEANRGNPPPRDDKPDEGRPASDAPADAPPRQYQDAAVIRFEGAIGAMLEQFFYRKLKAAEDQGADLVVIEIESPGGEADASFRIAETLRDVKWARTVAFIPKSAYSGAAVVAMGCDEILMTPTAQIGDVGVIFLDYEEFAMKYVEEKVLSSYVRRFRDLAEARGRSPALAEAMMDRKAEVHQYRNTRTGEQRFMTEADAK